MARVKITKEEYPTYRAWFVLFTTEADWLSPDIPPEHHPIAALDAMAARWPARAREGLAMAINDMVEMSADWSPTAVARFDAAFEEAGLPSLSAIRARFGRQLATVERRGLIRTETEYHLLRDAVETVEGESRRVTLWRLLADYEDKVAARTP